MVPEIKNPEPLFHMIRTKDINIINDALKYCHKNKNISKYTMVALLVRGKNILSVGKNNYRKTNPKTPQIKEYLLPRHAEVDCISRYIVKNRKITDDMTLYVVGITQGKNCRPVISSKPCDSCMECIRKHKIKRVVYCDYLKNEFTIKEMEIEK